MKSKIEQEFAKLQSGKTPTLIICDGRDLSWLLQHMSNPAFEAYKALCAHLKLQATNPNLN
jgi:hypothetical protein